MSIFSGEEKTDTNSTTSLSSTLDNIDNTVHEPVRLGILVLLMSHPNGLLFNEVQHALNLSPGNLSSHTQKLAKNKFIEIIKLFVDLKPRTYLKITENGVIALKDYARNLNKIIGEIYS